jgi:hypothetical protein
VIALPPHVPLEIKRRKSNFRHKSKYHILAESGAVLLESGMALNQLINPKPETSTLNMAAAGASETYPCSLK